MLCTKCKKLLKSVNIFFCWKGLFQFVWKASISDEKNMDLKNSICMYFLLQFALFFQTAKNGRGKIPSDIVAALDRWKNWFASDFANWWRCYCAYWSYVIDYYVYNLAYLLLISALYYVLHIIIYSLADHPTFLWLCFELFLVKLV